MQKDRETAFQNSLKNHEHNCKRYNRNRKPIHFKIGQFVYVNLGNSLNRNKLDEIYIGSFKITRQISNVLFEVDSGYQKIESNIYHVSKLYPFTVN